MIMVAEQTNNITVFFNDNKRRCLACGSPLTPRQRRYCSRNCPQDMRDRLNRRTGLLKALNTRYATFYFTEYTIIMDLLPFDTEQIFSFILPRSPRKKPVEDFCRMSNLLGNSWWAERNRTHKWYLASRHVLELARKSTESKETVAPLHQVVPSIKKESLITLKLKRSDLKSSQIQATIKRAYRRQAKKHHPDMGGDALMFRKLQEAYETLSAWAQHPTFVIHRGFPDKWFYDGRANRWNKPNPASP